MHTPLRVSAKELRPRVKEAWGAACAVCDRLQSRWDYLREGDYAPICSRCFLYETAWGKAQRENVQGMIHEVERGMESPFFRCADKTLLCKDADRILSAIALTSRIFDSQDRRR